MRKFGEILLEAGLITRQQFETLLAEQKGKKKRLGELIVDKGIATEMEIAQALSTQLGYPFVDLANQPIDPAALAIIDEEMARNDLIFPYLVIEKTLHIAMVDPLSFSAMDDVRFHTGLQIEPAIATRSDILSVIDKHYSDLDSLNNIVKGLGDHEYLEVMHAAEAVRDVTELKKKGEAPPIVRTVNIIISNAIKNRASDIHIEPFKDKIITRNRVDGILRNVMELPKWVHPAIVSRVKIMASLDISEKRRPQDGRIRVRSANFEVDLRVSVIPARFGEKVEIRLLSGSTSFKAMEEIGLSEKDYERIKSAVEMPQGVILVVGPTGSGKSTTLYAFLKHVQSEEINIETLEDPVEYEMEGINQIQINEKAGLTFAAGLRSMLRQDPDVMMVGEMRDQETAEIAMRASLTGHLVFSTLHTNDAASSITRLVDIGIPRYLIASSITAIVSQRLVRIICNDCKEPYTPSENDLKKLGVTGDKKTGIKLYRGRGCKNCSESGYLGRTAVYEILILNNRLRKLISSGADEDSLEDAAKDSGMNLLWEDAVNKVLDGITTLEEIERVVQHREAKIFLCPSCGRRERGDFLICPYCGEQITSRCPICEKPMEEDWKFCPYCLPSTVKKGEAEKVVKSDQGSQHNARKSGKALLKVENPVLAIAISDSGIRNRLERLLTERLSCSIISVTSGDELAGVVERDRPDFIVMDSGLQDAETILENLKKSGVASDIPLLLISDRHDMVDRVKLVQSGADDIIEKPFSDEEFLDRIGYTWEGKDIIDVDDGLKA